MELILALLVTIGFGTLISNGGGDDDASADTDLPFDDSIDDLMIPTHPISAADSDDTVVLTSLSDVFDGLEGR